MFYAIQGRNLHAALVTEDGVVRQATANFAWACGKRIDAVLGVVRHHGLRWRVSAQAPAGLVMGNGFVMDMTGFANYIARDSRAAAGRTA